MIPLFCKQDRKEERPVPMGQPCMNIFILYYRIVLYCIVLSRRFISLNDQCKMHNFDAGETGAK